MSTMTGTEFDHVYRAYNSERRERRGNTYIFSDPNEIYGVKFEGGLGLDNTGFIFRDIYKYTGDYTSHDENNPLIRTLFTYANGVKIVEKSCAVYSQTLDKYRWSHTVWLEDKDGNYLNLNAYMGKIITDTPDGEYIHGWYDMDDVSDYPVYYNIGQYAYGGDQDRCAYSFGPLGTCFVEIPTNSPYDRPELKGNLSENYVFTYYNYPTVSINDLNTKAEYDRFIEFIENSGDGTPITPELPSDDTSEPGGGDENLPDYNPFTDDISHPNLPTGGDAVSTGFVRLYCPSTAQLQNLAGVLWGNDFGNTIQKIQNDPMEAIISLHSVPFSLAGNNSRCVIGNFDTNIEMPAVTSQFHSLNMGSIYVPEHWASALDYTPYVKVDCFLPYVGIISVLVDDIVGRTISAQYNVDILTGATIVTLKCDGSVLYEYQTNIINSHPISASSYGRLLQSIVGGIGVTFGAMASGGIGGAVGGALGSAINTALSKHSDVTRGGSIGGSAGCLGNFTPYLIFHRPIQSLASGFAHFKGYPSNITTTLNSVSGYTEVESIHLNGITATDSEKAEIEALLYNGVLL